MRSVLTSVGFWGLPVHYGIIPQLEEKKRRYKDTWKQHKQEKQT